MNYCYVFIGPSGSGKTSLAEAIFSRNKRSLLTRIDHQDLGKKIKRIIILFLTIHSIR